MHACNYCNANTEFDEKKDKRCFYYSSYIYTNSCLAKSGLLKSQAIMSHNNGFLGKSKIILLRPALMSMICVCSVALRGKHTAKRFESDSKSDYTVAHDPETGDEFWWL